MSNDILEVSGTGGSGGGGGSPPTNQLQWFLNASTGNDSNSGANAGSPLQSFAELARRLGGGWPDLAEQIDIFSVGDFSAQPTWIVSINAQSTGLVYLHGTQTVLHTGTLTAASNHVAGGNTAFRMSAGALDFTPFVGMFMKITSGANAGAMAGIEAAPALGVAQCAEFLIPDAFNPFPAIGLTFVGNETFQIVAPTKVPQAVIEVNGTLFPFATDFVSMLVQDIEMPSGQWIITGTGGFKSITCRETAIYRCELVLTQGNVVTIAATNYDGVANGFVYAGCKVRTGAGVGEILIDEGSSVNFDGNHLNSGETNFVAGGGHVTISNLADIDQADDAWDIGPGGSITYTGTGRYWGNNVLNNLKIEPGGSVLYDSGFHFDFVAPVFTMGGASSITFFRMDTGAFVSPAVTLTYANVFAAYPGGFNNHCFDLLSGAKFVRTSP